MPLCRDEGLHTLQYWLSFRDDCEGVASLVEIPSEMARKADVERVRFNDTAWSLQM